VKMKRLVVIFAVLVFGAAAIAFAAVKASKSPYVIGAVFDITGPAAPLGTPERDTAQMIVEEINKKGGINGHPIKLIVYDNASDETKCALAVKKLISSDNVKAIIGPSTTGTTLAVVPICEKSKIPLVSCAAGIKITQPVKPYVFKTAQSDMHAVARIIEYLRSRGLKRIAFINDSNAFGTSGREQFRLQAPKASITIVAEESFDSKDTDMTSQLTRINAAKPQAVVCWGTNPGPAIVARNMKQLGMKMPLIMSHGVSNRKFIELAGSAAEGVIFPTGKLLVAESISGTDKQKPVLLKYASDFKAKYDRDADTFGGHAWDALQIVVNAMRKVGDNPKKLRDTIERTRGFVGVSGVFNFSPKDHNGLSKDAFVMVQVRNGRWVLLR